MTKKIKDGDVYKVVSIDNITFEIRYGYESPKAKENGWELMPIYPDFYENPQYTFDGYPFVTVYQGICRYYAPKEKVSGEDWCADCKWIEKRETYIGVCRCVERMQKNSEVVNNG